MKARVKATGEIFDVASVSLRLTGKVVSCYGIEEVDVLPHDETPDYWTRLEHLAGMVMQGMLSIEDYGNLKTESIIILASELAHALVEKLKGKEESK